MKFDSSKFLEPSEKYAKFIRLPNQKFWYNLDLIHMVYNYQQANDDEKQKIFDMFSGWLKSMDIETSFEDICKRFKDYSKKDFEHLLLFVMKKSKVI